MIKLAVILAPAYSGSTLFGLALGRHSEIICLGEAMYHEHDYQDEQLCTCGKQLKQCEFWSKVKIKLETSQSLFEPDVRTKLDNTAGYSVIDSRGGIKKIPLVFGVLPHVVFGNKEVARYKNKNFEYFKTIHEMNPDLVLLDLSKTPERIELIRQTEGLEVFCIYLKRKPIDVFSSTIKRPKKTRSKYGFKKIREAIWLNLRQNHEKRTFNKFDEGHKLQVSFDEFLKNPDQILSDVHSFLGINSNMHFGRSIHVNQQHLFVGNRWLFNLKKQLIQIKVGTQNPKITRLDRIIFSSVSFFFGNGKTN